MVNQTQTLDAEYSVIGALLLQPQIAGELFAVTGEADFVRDELRSVYIAARDIWTAGRQLDPVTIRAAIGKAYEPLLMACMDTCSSWRMWRDYVAAMQEQTRVSRLHEIADRLAQVQTSDEGTRPACRRQCGRGRKKRRAGRDYDGRAAPFFRRTIGKAEIHRVRLRPPRPTTLQRFRRLRCARRTAFGGQNRDGPPDGDAHGAAAKVGFYSLETSPAKLTNRIVAGPRVYRLRPVTAAR